MKVKKESEKVGIKLNIQKPKIMTSGPLTSRQIDGKQWKQWENLFWGAPKSLQMVTAAMKLKDACSLEEKGYDQPRQHIKKQRHYFANKGPSSQGYGFSSSYGWESWTIKKAEHQRVDAFELWCWIRLLRVPWTARRSNQPILKEISPEYSSGGLMLKLKCQYFGHLMWRTNSVEKTDPGNDWRQEEKAMTEDEMVRWHHRPDGHESEQAPGVGDGQGRVACCSQGGSKASDTTEWLNWMVSF